MIRQPRGGRLRGGKPNSVGSKIWSDGIARVAWAAAHPDGPCSTAQTFHCGKTGMMLYSAVPVPFSPVSSTSKSQKAS
jgi:hypothetical protein